MKTSDTSPRAQESAFLPLVKEVVESLGTLLAGHVRLARVELDGDARRFARRGAVVLLAGALLFVGYTLACVAAALALARSWSAPLAFLAIGGAHLVAGGAGLAVLLNRGAPRPLGDSLDALDRTVTTLSIRGVAAPEVESLVVQ
jgi:hypothetical protein